MGSDRKKFGLSSNEPLYSFTDNNPLILTTAKLDATRQRWAAALGEYNFDTYYRIEREPKMLMPTD